MKVEKSQNSKWNNEFQYKLETQKTFLVKLKLDRFAGRFGKIFSRKLYKYKILEDAVEFILQGSVQEIKEQEDKILLIIQEIKRIKTIHDKLSEYLII